MIKVTIPALIVGALTLAGNPALSQAETAGSRIEQAWRALGHADGSPDRLNVTAEIAGEAWMLEQSGTLDGGWIRLDQRASIQLDLLTGSGEVSETRQIPAWDNTPYGQSRIRFDETGAAAHWPTQDGAGRWTPVRSSSLRAAMQYRDIFPETLLQAAAAAPDLQLDDDGDLLFTRESVSALETVALHLDPGSAAPMGFTITTVFPDDIFLSVWSHAEVTGSYGFWWRDEDGRVLPRQLELTLDGRPWQRYELESFTLNPQDVADLPPVPEIGAGGPSVTRIDDFPFSTRHESPSAGVRVYYGAWNVMAAQLDDGVYIFDAPISNGYSNQVLEQVANDFDGQTVRGVITTSNAWPHMAGLAAYADAGIPIYLHPANETLVRATLAERANEADLRIVGDGDTPVSGRSGFQIHLAKGPALHGMMFAILPEAGLVWGSDALQLASGTADPEPLPHARQYVAEFLGSVCGMTEGMRALAMHQDPVDITALTSIFAADNVQPCTL